MNKSRRDMVVSLTSTTNTIDFWFYLITHQEELLHLEVLPSLGDAPNSNYNPEARQKRFEKEFFIPIMASEEPPKQQPEVCVCPAVLFLFFCV